MKNHVKVKKEKAHRTTYGEVAVAEGTLVLIDVSSSSTAFPIKLLVITENEIYKPVVISEMEEIEVGDLWLNTVDTTIQRFTESVREHFNNYGKKILALPENFSPKHLQAIVDGKMKDGDSVLVEVEREVEDFEGNPMYTGNFVVWTNQQGHVVIHKAEDQDNLSRHFVLLAIKAVQRKLDEEDVQGHVYWGQFEEFIKQIPAGTQKE